MEKVKDSGVSIATDGANAVFASLFENTVWENLPGVSIAYHAWKLFQGVNEYHFLTKLAAFLDNFHDCSDEFKEELRKLLNEEAGADKLGEKVMFLLNNADGKEKSRLLGKCLLAYHEEKIERDDLLRLWHVIDKCFIEDLKYLKITEPVNNNEVRSSLKNVGLVSGISIGEKGAHLLLTEMGCWLRDNILDAEN